MSKGYSFHIGLNNLDKSHYGDSYNKLIGCKNDACNMCELSIKHGFNREPIFKYNEKATFGSVTKALKAFSDAIVKPKDFLFVTLSGHGGQLKDKNISENDFEKDKYDETFCLYDKQILDDTLYQYLADFKEGVRILLLIDSCHSGTLTRSSDVKKFNVKELDVHQAKRVQDNNVSIYDEMLLNRNQRKKIKASVIQISACADNEKTSDGDPNGAFTTIFLDIMKNGFNGNYHDMHYELQTRASLNNLGTHPVIFFPSDEDTIFSHSKFLKI
ncbi:caspase family protein [Thiothrix subterranea]|uniref:Caspase family protein n=2 Tax=Thiothrix subterranea TaxID=2735563 RepID=A0AA51MSW7_9GAMM|nr:caspase family protein [Thiothrix subterranea]MDQ5770721.1 caspase family protein [Thiothrix subterranea]WML87721.1 caspase family protein [Thiothrix subterranea]